MLPDRRINRAQAYAAIRKPRGWFILGAAVASGGIASLAAASASGPFAGLHLGAADLVRNHTVRQELSAIKLFPSPSAQVVHRIVAVSVKPATTADPDERGDPDDMTRPTPPWDQPWSHDSDDDHYGRPPTSPGPVPSPTPPVASPSPLPSPTPCVSTPSKPC